MRETEVDQKLRQAHEDAVAAVERGSGLKAQGSEEQVSEQDQGQDQPDQTPGQGTETPDGDQRPDQQEGQPNQPAEGQDQPSQEGSQEQDA